VHLQIGETQPFIEELITNLQSTISELQPHQVQTFYEAVGYMVQAQTDAGIRENLLAGLMNLPNSTVCTTFMCWSDRLLVGWYYGHGCTECRSAEATRRL